MRLKFELFLKQKTKKKSNLCLKTLRSSVIVLITSESFWKLRLFISKKIELISIRNTISEMLQYFSPSALTF